MRTFTFDTNCIIDIDLNRPPAYSIKEILAAHRSGNAHAAFVAVSASERQQGDYYLTSYDQFLERLRALGLDDIPQIQGLAYCDLSYWDHALYADPAALTRERQIHEVLFPSIEFEFADFAQMAGISKDRISSARAQKWRNAWCDRQMLWSHDYHSRDVFVTSDRNFRKLISCQGFEKLAVCTPQEAVALLP